MNDWHAGCLEVLAIVVGPDLRASRTMARRWRNEPPGLARGGHVYAMR